MNKKQKLAIENMTNNTEIKKVLASENGSFYHFFKGEYFKALENSTHMRFDIILNTYGKIEIKHDWDDDDWHLLSINEIPKGLQDFDFIFKCVINNLYKMLLEAYYIFGDLKGEN